MPSLRVHRVRTALSTCRLARSPPYRSISRSVAVKGLLNGIFGNGGKPQSQPKELIDIETANFGEDPESIVISEIEGEQGKAKIVYQPGGDVDVGELGVLCEKVGWPKRPAEKVAGALKNSFLVCKLELVTEPASGDGEPKTRLIGLARATSDQVFNATVWDVLVDPEFQSQGLGKALVEQMIRHLLRRGIANITLFANADVVSFYEKMGFEADPDGIKGMFWYPKV